MNIQAEADRIIHRAVRQIPYAVFAYDQDDFNGGVLPMYHIVGGTSDGSSVTAETLRRMGIGVPDA